MNKTKIGAFKLINNYRNFANTIDNSVDVYLTEETWYCEPENREIFVFNPNKDTNQKHWNDFLQSVEIKLNKNNKHLMKTIPAFMWCFLHEMGHIQTEKKIYCILLPYRKITDFLSYHFASKSKLIDKLTTKMYYGMLDEVKATQWAVDYATKNELHIIRQSKEILKIYKKYFHKTLDN